MVVQNSGTKNGTKFDLSKNDTFRSRLLKGSSDSKELQAPY